MGKQWKQCQTIFLGSKITADGDCSHEIKRRLLLGRKTTAVAVYTHGTNTAGDAAQEVGGGLRET